MKVASLFSGIGGFELGFVQAGHEITLQCESDPAAQQVLKKRFPGVLLSHDICSLERLPPETEVVTAGFPCIDVSRAGRKQGLDGSHTSLVRHVFRLLGQAVRDHRPVPWVVLENVEGILDRIGPSPPVIDFVTVSLQRLGYSSWAYRVLNTAGFGLPQHRRRVFVVASYYGDARDVLLSQGVDSCSGACSVLFNRRPCYACHEPSTDTGSFAIDLGNAQASPPLDCLPTLKTANTRICLALENGLFGSLRVEDAERAQGFPEGWTTVTAGNELGASSPEALLAAKWRMIGNAVSVPVSFWLGQALANPYVSKFAAGARDQVFPFASSSTHTPAEAATEAAHQADWDWHKPSAGGYFNYRQHGESGPDCLTAEEFSFLAADKYKRKELFSEDSKRPKQHTDRWPSAAWYTRNLGRYKTVASDSPTITAYPTLAGFITKVGLAPSQESIEIWANRMREQGRDVSLILERIQQHGTKLHDEVRQVVRISGGVQDGDMIGTLVWSKAPLSRRVWWPAEVLDPYFMPLVMNGCSYSGMTKAVFEASIPNARTTFFPSDWLAAIHSANKGKDKVTETRGETTYHGPRKVLVVFLGLSMSAWLSPDDLKPYRPHKAEKELEASGLASERKLPKERLFKEATEEASRLAAIQDGVSEARDVSALAAYRAAAINRHMRCQICETCLKSQMSNQRCLSIRAAAAAASGHAGAQLGVLGHQALGAKIEVYWPLEQSWFPGMVTAYDSVKVEHTVCYDDGDVEILRLWAPNQTVRAVSKISNWKNDLAVYNKKAEQIAETAINKMASLVGKRKEVEATLLADLVQDLDEDVPLNDIKRRVVG